MSAHVSNASSSRTMARALEHEIIVRNVDKKFSMDACVISEHDAHNVDRMRTLERTLCTQC